jgi:hypothetical protein
VKPPSYVIISLNVNPNALGKPRKIENRRFSEYT